MVPPDIVYCDQCGGASPSGSPACRFCGAALRPPPPVVAAPVPPRPSDAADPAAEDPWAALTADEGVADPHEGADAWADPSGTPWQAEPEPTAAYETPAAPWSIGTAALVEADAPRRGLPGWAWAAVVVLLGTALGTGAYVLVDRTDDSSVRTTDTSTSTTSTSSSTSTSTSTTSTTTTVATTLPPTTVPVVPATPPATPPVTGPPTVPGAVTAAPTVPAPTEAPTTPAPVTAAPTAPPPTAPPPPPTPAPTTAPPTTTTPPSTVPGAAPGDLGIAGIPMSRPACDGQYITILASTKQTTASAMEYALENDFPGASYLRSDQTCPSLNVGSSDGLPLYRIFVGPFPDPTTACAARAQSTRGAFVKRLSDESPLHAVPCPETV